MTIEQLPDTWPVARHIATLRAHLPSLAQRYHIRALGVFGSYVRNEQSPASDLDVLVEFDTLPGLFTYVALQDQLAALLGVPVDLVHRADVKPHVAESLLAEVVMI